MGRHSSRNQTHFYRSLFGWVGLWVMVGLTAGVGVWFLVTTLGGGEAPTLAAGEQSAKSDRTAEAVAETEPAPEPDPSVSGLRVAKEDKTAPASATSREETPELVTKGVTVQVLNGTMNSSAGEAMAKRLTELGFTVVAVEESSKVYSETTVLWSTDQGREAATALAENFDWLAEPKPSNLSDTVTFHVVVGADEG